MSSMEEKWRSALLRESIIPCARPKFDIIESPTPQSLTAAVNLLSTIFQTHKKLPDKVTTPLPGELFLLYKTRFGQAHYEITRDGTVYAGFILERSGHAETWRLRDVTSHDEVNKSLYIMLSGG